MTAISPRRGMIRPISDLPAPASPARWSEIEGVDGKAYKTPASNGASFPDDPAGFGTVNADDEEWNAATDINRWTIESALPAPHSYVINDTFAPSRIRVNWTDDGATAYLSLYRTPSSVILTPSTDFNLTFDISGAFPVTSGSPCIGVGVRASAAANSAGVLMCATVDSAAVQIREYTNIGTGQFTSRMAKNLGSGPWPRRWFLHLERHGADSWAAGYSSDGVAWKWERALAVTATAQTLLWVLIKRDNTGIPNQLANNWIRWNRFYLAAT